MNIRALLLGCAAMAVAAPAFAHHSFSMFDREKNVTMSGVVTEYEWTNPHTWIHMKVPDQLGKEIVWSFEMQAIAPNTAGGWRVDSVKPGDKVTIEFHPLKDGSRGGQLVSATLANGTHLGGPVRRPAAQD